MSIRGRVATNRLFLADACLAVGGLLFIATSVCAQPTAVVPPAPDDVPGVVESMLNPDAADADPPGADVERLEASLGSSIRARDWTAVAATAGPLRDAMTARGWRNHPALAATLLATAWEAEREGQHGPALELVRTAEIIAPDLWQVPLMRASLHLAGEHRSLGEGFRALQDTLERRFADDAEASRVSGQLAVAMGFGLAFALLLAGLFAGLRYAAPMMIDYRALTRSRAIAWAMVACLGAIAITGGWLGGVVSGSLLALSMVSLYLAAPERIAYGLLALAAAFYPSLAAMSTDGLARQTDVEAAASRCLRGVCTAEDAGGIRRAAVAGHWDAKLVRGIRLARAAAVGQQVESFAQSVLREAVVERNSDVAALVSSANARVAEAAHRCQTHPEEAASGFAVADALYSRALLVDANAPSALYNLSLLRQRDGKLNEARGLASRARELAPARVERLKPSTLVLPGCPQRFNANVELMEQWPGLAAAEAPADAPLLWTGPQRAVLFGHLSPRAVGAVAWVAIGVLLLGAGLRSRWHPTGYCGSCGRLVPPDEENHSPGLERCAPCLQSFARAPLLGLAPRPAKREPAPTLRALGVRLLGLILPGGVSVLAGRPFWSLLLSAAFAGAASMLLLDSHLLDPMALDAVGEELWRGGVMLVSGALYVVAVLIAQQQIRQLAGRVP